VPALDAERASFSTRVRLRGSCNDRQGRVPSRPSEAVASNSLLMLCPARCKTGFAMTDRRCHGARLCPAVTQPASDSVIPRLLACLEPAANLVLQRSDELDGDHYEVLTPAADALSGTHPLAATLALRAMIDFSLKNNRSSRYRYAAPSDRLLEPGIGDRGFWEVTNHAMPTKPGFVANIRGRAVLEFG